MKPTIVHAANIAAGITIGIRWTLTVLLIIAIWHWEWAVRLTLTLLLLTNEAVTMQKAIGQWQKKGQDEKEASETIRTRD